MHWKRLALAGLLLAVCVVAASLSPEGAPAAALGFTSTPTFTPEPPTATATTAPPTATATLAPPTATATTAPTATLQPTATATKAPTLAPQPTQPPPQPTQPPQPQPTEVPPTPVPASAPSVPKTGSGLLWVVAAAGLGALLFGARKARTS